MITNKCSVCGIYTFNDEHCKEKTKSAHYKFLRFKSQEEYEKKKLLSKEDIEH